jgi:MFS family permease
MKNLLFDGWTVIFGAILVMGVLWGSLASFGVFFKPISHNLCLSRAATSAAFSTNFVVNGFFGIITGWLTDKYGPRKVVIPGAILSGLGYLLMSQLTSPWELYLFFGVITALGQSVYWAPLMATVSRWFKINTPLAIGIVLVGLGIGQMTMPPLMAVIINEYGWRVACIIMAILIWLIAIPGAILLRHRTRDERFTVNSHAGQDNTNPADKRKIVIQLGDCSSGEALRTIRFWLLFNISFAVAGSLQILLVHIVPYATDVGISAPSAALILTIMGFAGIFARFLSGVTATKIGNKRTLLFCLIFQAFALFALIEARSLRVFFVLGGLFSLGFSGCAPLTASMVGDLFGLRSVGTIIGLINVGWSLGSAFGPYFAGYVYDTANNYALAFLSAGMIVITAIGSAYLLRPSS